MSLEYVEQLVEFLLLHRNGIEFQSFDLATGIINSFYVILRHMFYIRI